MGIYSDKAIKMANEIKGLNKIITEEGAELESSLRLIAELDLIRSQMQDLLKKIGPAIHALGLMRGVWGAIADDLRNIRSAVDGTSGNSRIIIQKLSQKKIVDRWNALGKEVDAFRKAAYVDAPKEMTASEAAGYFNKLGEVKTAS